MHLTLSSNYSQTPHKDEHKLKDVCEDMQGMYANEASTKRVPLLLVGRGVLYPHPQKQAIGVEIPNFYCLSIRPPPPQLLLPIDQTAMGWLVRPPTNITNRKVVVTVHLMPWQQPAGQNAFSSVTPTSALIGLVLIGQGHTKDTATTWSDRTECSHTGWTCQPDQPVALG